MILVTADIPFEQRAKAIKEAHRAKREFARVVMEELPKALLAETSFKDSIDPSRGIRAALKGGRGTIRQTEHTDDGTEVGIGISYAAVPWWRIQDQGGVIRAKNVRNLTIPVDDAAAMALYRAGGARNIPNLKAVRFGGRAALVKEASPDVPFIWLKPSVTIKARPYVTSGVARFERTAWRRLLDVLPPMIAEGRK